MKNTIIVLTGLLLAGIMLSGGCIKEPGEDISRNVTPQFPDSTQVPSPIENRSSGINGTGTVRFIPIEGGFYGIVGNDGEHYDPINLGKEFQVDGLRVRFEAKKRDDQASFHMWGTLIEIINIERI